ncbi:unnamed protein product [Schistocephalus solidus]|uniref:Uncharacterized protein n=1 Tax=Schistocephalus solidus TaxID=70667 RepID=A0A183TQ17_SCHSO|nr:unnamed protein product [Schistocephalus solidus]
MNRNRIIGIVCWNVRNLLDPGAQSRTVCSLYQYAACQNSEYLTGNKDPGSQLTLHHVPQGPRDFSGRHGVVIAFSQQANRALRAWEPVNERMVYVRLKGHFTNISTVSVDTLTSAAEQRDKETFSSQLQALAKRLPRRDLLVVAGG